MKKLLPLLIVLIASLLFGGRQPHMQKALKHLYNADHSKVGHGKIIQLKKAKQQLKVAARNKGGHRVKAIEMINTALIKIHKHKRKKAQKFIHKAITHVEKGIKHANKKHKKHKKCKKCHKHNCKKHNKHYDHHDHHDHNHHQKIDVSSSKMKKKTPARKLKQKNFRAQ